MSVTKNSSLGQDDVMARLHSPPKKIRYNILSANSGITESSGSDTNKKKNG